MGDQDGWRSVSRRTRVLTGGADRMPGSTSETDDARQDARLRLSRFHPSGVENPRARLTTVAYSAVREDRCRCDGADPDPCGPVDVAGFGPPASLRLCSR